MRVVSEDKLRKVGLDPCRPPTCVGKAGYFDWFTSSNGSSKTTAASSIAIMCATDCCQEGEKVGRKPEMSRGRARRDSGEV